MTPELAALLGINSHQHSLDNDDDSHLPQVIRSSLWHGRRAQYRDQPSEQEDNQRSLVRTLRDGSLSTIGSIANVLDVPGSMIRDIIGGHNPFDQLLSPFSSANRTSGRDLARQYGMAERRDTWSNAIGGFLAEVGLDPLSYASFGLSALGKSGQAAKGLGLLDDVASVAARKAGQQIGTIGPRQARVSTALDDFLKYGDEPAKAKAQQLVNQGFNPSEPMGGMLGLGLPFRPPAMVAGTGNKTQRIASGIDVLADAIRYAKIPGTTLQPVNSIARLFDSSINNAVTPFGQAVARQHANKLGELESGARGELADYATKLSDANAIDPMSGTVMRDALESVLPMDFLKGAPLEVAQAMKGNVDQMPTTAKHWGIKLEPFNDSEIDYFPRKISQNQHRPFSKDRPTQRIEPKDVDMSRLDFLTDVPGGTGAIAAIAKDDVLNDLIKGGASSDQLAQHIGDTFPWLPDHYTKRVSTGDELMPSGRHQEFADWLASLSDDTRKSGVFGNSPVMDYHTRRMSFDRSVQGARTIRDALVQPDVLMPAGKLAAGHGVKLSDFIKQAGLEQGDGLADGFIARLRESMPSIDASKVELRKSHADDLRSFMDTIKTPEVLNDWINMLDSVTNFSKSMWTGVMPSFHSRNLVSGQVHNAMLGMADPASLKGAHNLLRGQAVVGAKDLTAIQDEWARQLAAQALPDTRGKGVQYHGARGPIDKIHDGYYSSDNIYGGAGTFYTTDAADIATGYGRKNPNAKVYRVDELAPVSFFDMEKPLDSPHLHQLFGHDPDGVVSDAIDAVAKEGKASLRHVMDEVRQSSSYYGLSKDSVQDMFSNVTYNLQRGGFGGMSHTGGLKTGHAPHTVKIYLDPANQISIKDTNYQPRTNAKPPELTDEEATNLLGKLAFRHQVLGKFEGNAASIAGDSAPVGGQINDVLAELLAHGSPKVSARSVATKAIGKAPGTSFLPWEVRGVGGRQSSAFAPAAAGEEVGHYVEGLNRLTPFINLLKKGVDPAEAARRVGIAQVSYGNRYYTPFERQVMRRVFPFYSFTSRMAKQVGSELTQHPGGPLAQLIRSSNQGQQGELVPSYVREGTTIPLNSDNPIFQAIFGTPTDGTKRFITGLGLAHEDALSFGPSAREVGAELLSRANPAIKLPLELITGRSLNQRGSDGSGRRLEDSDPTLGRLAANLTGKEQAYRFPQWLETVLSNSPASVALSKAKSISDPHKRVAGTPIPGLSAIIPGLTGVRVTDVSPAQQQRVLENLIDEELMGHGGRKYERTFIPKSQQLSEKDAKFIAELRKLQSDIAKSRRQSQNAN